MPLLLLKRYRPVRRHLATFFLVGAIALVGLPNIPTQVGSIQTQTVAIAQPTPIRRIDPILLSHQVYQQLPDLPLENQYLSSETGAPAAENTLLSRLIRYHVYSKNRPTVFRLDWKLTIADYLGAFEPISASSYPDYGLSENPYANDIAAIDSLSVEQRTRLVNILYETFTDPGTAEDSSPDTSATNMLSAADSPQ